MSAILTAFADMQRAYRGLYHLPDTATDADAEPLHERRDQALVVMKNTAATTSAEHAAKLRAGLQGINQDGEDGLILYDLRELLDADLRGIEGLTTGDFFEGLIWSTIVDLEQQSAPVDRAGWEAALAEHDSQFAKFEALGEEFTDEDIDRVSDEYSPALDRLIGTPAPDMRALLRKFEIMWGADDHLLSNPGQEGKETFLADLRRLAAETAHPIEVVRADGVDPAKFGLPV